MGTLSSRVVQTLHDPKVSTNRRSNTGAQEQSLVTLDFFCGVLLITPIFRTKGHILRAHSDGRGFIYWFRMVYLT